MRLVSYNIFGGEGRIDPLAEVIEAQRPDVVGLVEADKLQVVERLAKRLNMDFIHATGNNHASALLSRWPIRDSINHALLTPGLSRSMVEATVVDPEGTAWPMAVLHLYPYAGEEDERRREEELQLVLNIFADHRSNRRPHVLMGDFNANAPYQQIDVPKCRPNTQKAYHKNGGSIPRRVVQRLMDEGYVDTLYAVHGPAIASTATFTTRYPGQRLDYIFTWNVNPSRLKAAWVEDDRLATFASDHYLIGCEIAPSSATE